MNNCEWKVKTKIIFGKDAECNVGEEMKKLGKKCLFVHYGATGPHIYESGLYDRIVKSLTDAGMEFVELQGVVPNPRVSLMRQGVELCKKEGVDCMLGVGGGSVFDTCKGIGVAVCGGLDILEYCRFKNPINGCLPLGCIATIPAAGSEVSNCAVIVDDDGEMNHKVSMFSEHIRPAFTILNPELTYSLPAGQTASGACDIITHTLERYFGDTGVGGDLIDRWCEQLIVSVMGSLKAALRDPKNYAARSELMLAADYAHNTILDFGRLADWGIHGVESCVTTYKDMPHGYGLAAVSPAFMRYVYKRDMLRFKQFAVRVMGVSPDFRDDEGIVLEGIARYEQFLHSVGLPTTITEMGCTEADIEYLANAATAGGTAKAGAVFQLDIDDLRKIYRNAL